MQEMKKIPNRQHIELIGWLDIPNLCILQVLKKADMIRKNAVESILAERDILISVRNPFVVSLLYMTMLSLCLLYDHLLLILCLVS